MDVGVPVVLFGPNLQVDVPEFSSKRSRVFRLAISWRHVCFGVSNVS